MPPVTPAVSPAACRSTVTSCSLPVFRRVSFVQRPLLVYHLLATFSYSPSFRVSPLFCVLRLSLAAPSFPPVVSSPPPAASSSPPAFSKRRPSLLVHFSPTASPLHFNILLPLCISHAPLASSLLFLGISLSYLHTQAAHLPPHPRWRFLTHRLPPHLCLLPASATRRLPPQEGKHVTEEEVKATQIQES